MSKRFDEEWEPKWGKWITTAILWILWLIIVFDTFFTVQPWQRAVLVTFWNVSDSIYSEWLHLKAPLIQKIKKIDIKTQKEEVESMSASKDLQNVTTKMALNFSIDHKWVRKLFMTVWNNDDIKRILIDPAIQESVKAATAKFTAEELITKRTLVRESIMTNLKEKLSIDNIDIIALNITNFKFSDVFDAAIEQKVKAEQDALTQKNKLEQIKYEAQQTIETAKAKAESIRIQAQAINSQWWADYVKIKRVEKRDGKLPVTTLWSNMEVLMQMK